MMTAKTQRRQPHLRIIWCEKEGGRSRSDSKRGRLWERWRREAESVWKEEWSGRRGAWPEESSSRSSLGSLRSSSGINKLDMIGVFLMVHLLNFLLFFFLRY